MVNGNACDIYPVYSLYMKAGSYICFARTRSVLKLAYRERDRHRDRETDTERQRERERERNNNNTPTEKYLKPRKHYTMRGVMSYGMYRGMYIPFRFNHKRQNSQRPTKHSTMCGGMFYGLYILVCMSRFLLITSGKIHHKDLQTSYNVRCGVF